MPAPRKHFATASISNSGERQTSVQMKEISMANDQPADNNDCTRTIRVSRGRVRVNEGQHLHYFVTAKGARPVFSLSCTHKTHFDAAGLGPPKQDYEVIWPRDSADEG